MGLYGWCPIKAVLDGEGNSPEGKRGPFANWKSKDRYRWLKHSRLTSGSSWNNENEYLDFQGHLVGPN